jgi:hypothetical protein
MKRSGSLRQRKSERVRLARKVGKTKTVSNKDMVRVGKNQISTRLKSGSNTAVKDDYVEWLLSQRGTIDRDVDLGC